MARHDDHEGISPKVDSLKILLIEDDPNDVAICRRILSKHCPEIHLDVATTLQEFAERLHASHYELVLSDFNLGKGTASDAFALLREEKQEIPIILVTGTLGEERAVQCIKDGMADFILKDRLERLPFAISRALEEKKLRNDTRQAAIRLRESEQKFRALADAIPAAIFIEENGSFVYVNRSAVEISGYSREQLMQLNFSHLVHPDSKDAVAEHQAKCGTSMESPYRVEIMIQPKEREPRWLDITVGTFFHNGSPAILTTAFDISERKRASREIHLDPITGLPTHLHLQSVFDAEALRTKRTGRAFSVLILSMDGIKQIAAQHGQLAAGQALTRAARTTLLHCRNLDTVARIGAQQFALLLPETDSDGANILGARIAARLGSTGHEFQLPCRFATAAHPKNGESLEQVLNAANLELRPALRK